MRTSRSTWKCTRSHASKLQNFKLTFWSHFGVTAQTKYGTIAQKRTRRPENTPRTILGKRLCSRWKSQKDVLRLLSAFFRPKDRMTLKVLKQYTMKWAICRIVDALVWKMSVNSNYLQHDLCFWRRKTRISVFLYLTGMPFSSSSKPKSNIWIMAHANLVAVDHSEKRQLTI